MCYGCYIEAGSPKIINDKVIELAILIELIDEFGYAHIVVSDWNLEDSNIDFCIDLNENNIECKDDEEVENTKQFLFILKELSEPERYTAMALSNGFINHE